MEGVEERLTGRTNRWRMNYRCFCGYVTEAGLTFTSHTF